MTNRTYFACVSIFCDRLQKVFNEVLCIVADIFPVPLMEDDRRIAALFDKILQILASERGVSAKQRVGNDTQGPHIYWLPVPLLEHDFWSGISKRTSHCC
jgi:hypothetical protein